MAITKSGQKLVKRTFFAEFEDWKKFTKIAKSQNKSVGQCVRQVIRLALKNYDEQQKTLDEKKATE